MARYVKTPSCVWKFCKRCDNNAGGACSYDHDAEAKELGIEASEIVTDDRCLLFCPVQEEE